MNLIDFQVVKVLTEPEFKYNKWFVKVRVTSWGCESETDLCFDTKDECLNVKIGYTGQF